MASLDNSIIVRLKTLGENFEILADPDLALTYKEGKDIPLNEILAVDCIFKDARAGDKASEDIMSKIFDTHDVNNVADQILKKGELHLTTQQKKHLLEERKKQIINIIAKNAINPQTKSPHPPGRIKKAMEEVKINVTISKSAKEQVDTAVKALRPILPLKFERISIVAKIPLKYSGNIHHTLEEFGEVKKEEWVSDGLISCLEIPAGLQDEFYDKLNNVTHGEVEIKILK